MRLLHIDTWNLREFHGSPPPYAVTSHRWTDEEVTFQEISSSNVNADKAGYRKIQMFITAIRGLKRACPQLDGKLEWIWIDTCCIDKTNSVELGEALNSMFKWYKQAEVCLAFLHDVVSLNEHPTEVERSFFQSIWFTRGWTLQELLAPKRVLFYNQEWEIIGRKKTVFHTPWITAKVAGMMPLNSLVAKRTGIPEQVLWDLSSAENTSIEKKRSWMEGRVTSREEDFVYCQLGIFEVFLPLIYGEGGDHAMVRLEEAIERKQRHKAKLSIPVSEPTPPSSSLSESLLSLTPVIRPVQEVAERGSNNMLAFTINYKIGSPRTSKWRQLAITASSRSTVGNICAMALNCLQDIAPKFSVGQWKLWTYENMNRFVASDDADSAYKLHKRDIYLSEDVSKKESNDERGKKGVRSRHISFCFEDHNVPGRRDSLSVSVPENQTVRELKGIVQERALGFDVPLNQIRVQTSTRTVYPDDFKIHNLPEPTPTLYLKKLRYG